MISLTDGSDPRLDPYRHLTDAAARAALDEHGAGTFIVEGALALEQLLASGHQIRSILVTPNRVDRVARLGVPSGVELLVADRSVLREVTGYDVHRGVLAAARRPLPRRLDEVLDRGRDAVLVEGVTDNENVGAIFRNVAALGLGCVVLDRRCADPLYRRCIRVSSGWSLRVPFAVVDSIERAVQHCLDAGHRVVALTPAPDAHDVADAAAAGLLQAPLSLVVGAEGSGLEPATVRAASCSVRVPMQPEVDSLNVATSLAVVGAFVDAARRSSGVSLPGSPRAR